MSFHDKVAKVLKKSVICFPLACSLLLLLYYTVASMNSTVYVSEYEKRFYCRDYPLLHIGIAGLLLLSIIFFGNRFKGKAKSVGGRKIPIIIILTVYAAFLVLVCAFFRLLPKFDQNYCFQIAGQLINHDYSGFLKGGYAEKWTNNWGYILLLAGEYKLFGMKNLIAVYAVNILFQVGIAFEMYQISAKFLRTKSLAVLVAVCFFAPAWTYVTFAYGNFPSLFFCLLAFDLLYGFFENTNIGKGVMSAVCITVALILKTTSLILFIAYLIYAATRILFEHREKSVQIARILVIAFSITLYFAAARGVHSVIEHITGMKLGNGVPRISQIAMGMHENENGSGWYDGLIDMAYEENGFDEERTEEAVRADLNASLRDFRNNPTGFIGFCSRKALSMWIEPTYQSIFILQNRNTYSEKPLYPVNELQSDRPGILATRMMDLMQSLMYLGSFLFFFHYACERVRKKDWSANIAELLDPLLAGIIITGGFLFYTLWEAKSQYSISFVIFLVPTAVQGFCQTAAHLETAFQKKEYGTSVSFLLPLFLCIALPILVSFAPDGTAVERMLASRWSTSQYKDFLNEKRQNGVKAADYVPIDHTLSATKTDNDGKARFPAGRYLVSCCADPSLFLICDGSEAGCDVKVGNFDEKRVILTSTERGYCFRFQGSQKVMDVETGAVTAGTRVQQWDYNGDDSQIFRFVPSGENLFRIAYTDDLFLTAHEDGSVTVESEDPANLLQQWRIEAE